MNIEDDLNNFLEKKIKSNANKLRNIEILLYYYGFRGEDWPTYEETAKKFDIGTRERVRQLLNQHFRDHVKPADLPSINSFYEIVSSKDYWKLSELENLVLSSGIVEGNFSIRGILNLLNDLNINCNFDIYTPELKKSSRKSFPIYKEHFAIRNSKLKKIRSLLKKAIGLPGRCGIAQVNYLEKELDEYNTLISQLIKNYPNSWTYEENGEFWYIIENRDNTIINYSEKLFSLIDSCDATQLAGVYRNALDGRSYKYPYPEEEIIKKYLESSIFFENNEGTLTFTGEPREANDIEKDVVSYLKNKPYVDFPKFRDHLREKGYGDAHIQKAISSSPFVYIDKSEGRTNYRYSLTGSKNQDLTINDSKYEKYKKELEDIAKDGLDSTTEVRLRKEQRLLRRYLFEEDQEECAICNKTYSTRTLVAAHKAKRSSFEQDEIEQLTDPDIVMPICLVGCDYFYEEGHIYIDKDSGTVKRGIAVKYGKAELEIINDLIGNEVDEKWLSSSYDYFGKHKKYHNIED